MSKLGNIYLSYGKQFNVSIANTYSYNVLKGSNLPINSLIISSPIKENNNDVGTYSLIASDFEGNPVRLTYTIKEGNGFGSNEENKDVIYLNIDNDTIKETDNGIKIDLSVFNSDIIYINNNKFVINTNKLNDIDINKRGIAKPDNKTIKNDGNKIFVNTEKLEYSNNATNQYGIIISGDNIIDVDNGIISLNENNLPKSQNNKYGIIKGDEYTINIINNEPYVNTQNLDHCTSSSFGIISVDGNKILSNEGTLYVNSNSLNNADNNNLGLLSIDNSTIVVDENGSITIPDYNNIINDIDNIVDEMDNNINSLENIKNDILIQIK